MNQETVIEEYSFCNYSQLNRHCFWCFVFFEAASLGTIYFLPQTYRPELLILLGFGPVVAVGLYYLIHLSSFYLDFHFKITKEGIYVEGAAAFDYEIPLEQIELVNQLGLSYLNEVGLPYAKEGSKQICWEEIASVERGYGIGYRGRYAPPLSYLSFSLTLQSSTGTYRSPRRLNVLREDFPLFKKLVQRFCPGGHPLREFLEELGEPF